MSGNESVRQVWYSVGRDRRVYAIGDIHGRADLVRDLCNAIRADYERAPAMQTVVVMLGDYVDRGPDSCGVLSFLAGNPFPVPSIALKGNHEQMMLAFLQSAEAAAQWRRLGGLETLHAYGVPVGDVMRGREYESARESFASRLPAAHLEFVQRLPASIRIGDVHFCHAGVRPGVSLDEQREEDLLWIRDEFLESDEDFGALVVHGHSPVEQPEVRRNRINIDTGAFATGVLTALVIEDNRIRFLSTGRVN